MSRVPAKFVTVTDGGLTIIEKERGGSDIEDRNGKLILENAKYVIPLRNDYFLYGQNRKKFSLLGPNGE